MAKYENLHEAITKVLSTPPQDPMRAGEIWDEIAFNDWWESEAVIPEKGVITELLKGVKAKPPRYERVGWGLYRIHPKYASKKSGAKKREKSQTGNEPRLIQAFGMFWSRREWEENSPPKLMGKKPNGAPFNFCDQRGIYILYDSHKVVYVGLAAKQGIGKRLKDHTTDRHKSRWDRFSWFGIRKLDEGKKRLIDRSTREKLPQESIISDLEALLIEVAEPVQQRQRGKGMQNIEFLQAPKGERHSR